MVVVDSFLPQKMTKDYLAIKVIKCHYRIIGKLTSYAKDQTKTY